MSSISALAVASLLCLSAVGSAQLGGLTDKLKVKNPVTAMLEGKPPITTSLSDAKFEAKDKDALSPTFTPMTSLQRTATGGFVLQAGAFEVPVQSYCLKAGTHGPGGGDGYLYAPPKGPAELAVVAIVRNSVNHPEIPQQKIQTLLWAIIARAKMEDLSQDLKATAAVLLTPEQLLNLNRSALDILSSPILQKALGDAPPGIREVLRAEADLRRMLNGPSTTFEELERAAMLNGEVGIGAGSRQVPENRWSKHPDGYFVRYLPEGYSGTVIQIVVEENSKAIGKEFDPALHIAVPGNTNRQRLIQSGRLFQDQ